MLNKDIFDPVQTGPFEFKIKLKAQFWKLINGTIFKIMPSRFKMYRIVLLRIFGATLANDVNIHPLARIDHPWNLTMGKLSSLGDRAWAYCLAPIKIGEKCCIGKDVYLLTGTHDVNDANFKLITKSITINDCCWVATGAYLLPGVTLSEYTVVGAKSVVTRNTEKYSIVGGNPATFIKYRKII
jgi:putative colanic acid biosynthesis acetyltransferase WcaF